MIIQNLKKLRRFIVELYYDIIIYIFKIKVNIFDDMVLKNKKVIVIGPASSSLTYMDGPEIDKFDFIIRINKSHLNLHNNIDKLGTRTDILFHCCYPHPINGCDVPDEDKLIQQQNKYVIYPYNLRRSEIDFKRCLIKNKKLNMRKLNPSYFNDILQIYPAKYPTTGFQALYYLLHQDLKELHITGFTFLTTPYVDGYRDSHKDPVHINNLVKQSGNHNPEAELNLFTKMINKRKNIFLDSELKKIIYG